MFSQPAVNNNPPPTPRTRSSSSGLRPGRTIGPYCLLYQLGEGGFAPVWFAVNTILLENDPRHPIYAALKMLPTGQTGAQMRRNMNEVKMLEKVQRHHNVIAYLGQAQNEDEHKPENFVALVFPVIEDGSLEQYLKRKSHRPLRPKIVFLFFFQLICAIEHCHSKGVAHRDIKPANILINRKTRRLWLTDFGLATNQTSVQNAAGTRPYQAPEVIALEFGFSRTTAVDPFRTDIWSLGVLLYRLLTGSLPFNGPTPMERYQQMFAAKRIVRSSLVRGNVCKMLFRLLAPVPCHRIPLEKIRTHPWWFEQCAKHGIDRTSNPMLTLAAATTQASRTHPPVDPSTASITKIIPNCQHNVGLPENTPVADNQIHSKPELATSAAPSKATTVSRGVSPAALKVPPSLQDLNSILELAGQDATKQPEDFCEPSKPVAGVLTYKRQTDNHFPAAPQKDTDNEKM